MILDRDALHNLFNAVRSEVQRASGGKVDPIRLDEYPLPDSEQIRLGTADFEDLMLNCDRYDVVRTFQQNYINIATEKRHAKKHILYIPFVSDAELERFIIRLADNTIPRIEKKQRILWSTNADSNFRPYVPVAEYPYELLEPLFDDDLATADMSKIISCDNALSEHRLKTVDYTPDKVLKDWSLVLIYTIVRPGKNDLAKELRQFDKFLEKTEIADSRKAIFAVALLMYNNTLPPLKYKMNDYRFTLEPLTKIERTDFELWLNTLPDVSLCGWSITDLVTEVFQQGNELTMIELRKRLKKVIGPLN